MQYVIMDSLFICAKSVEQKNGKLVKYNNRKDLKNEKFKKII